MPLLFRQHFIFKFIENSIVSDQFPNHLALNSINLDNHLISKENSSKKSIFILGGSSVAGSNIPISTTLADYLNANHNDFISFNLAEMEGTTLEALIFLKLGLEKRKPSLVVIGLSPDMFNPGHMGVSASANLTRIKEDLPLEAYARLRNERRKKQYSALWTNYLQSEAPPMDILLIVKSFFYNLKINFWGETMSKNIAGNNSLSLNRFAKEKNVFVNVEAITKICQKNNIKLIAYLEPIYSANMFYQKENFTNYLTIVKTFLKDRNVEVFDYTNLLPASPDYFVDIIHLKPKGYERLAKEFWSDFEKVSEQRDRR